MKPKAVTITIVLIAFTLWGSACSGSSVNTSQEATAIPLATADTGVVAEGRVEPGRYVDIGFNASGLVSEVLAEEGDQVQAGQVIARVQSKEAKTLESAQTTAAQELADANETLRLAQIKLDDFGIPADYRTMSPEQAVNAAYQKLEKAREDYGPYKYLNARRPPGALNDSACKVRNGIVTCRNMNLYYQRILDDAWKEYKDTIEWLNRVAVVDDAKARVAKAQENLANLQAGADPELTAGTRASLATAELSAPISGTLTKLDVKVGETATVGAKVVTIADFSKWVVKTTDLTEIDVVKVSQGQTVKVALDAIPGVTLTGKVESIGQSYSEKQGDIVYEVTIVLEDTHLELRWGMTAEVTFEQ